MTDKEIVQSLRCCAEGECKDCTMHEDTMPLATKNMKQSVCGGCSRRSNAQQSSTRSCCKAPSPPCW